jgi:hypothetical protein
MKKTLSFAFLLLVAACSAGTTNGTTNPSPSNVVGKSCTSNGDCGAGYVCDTGSSSPNPPTCTPDRACTPKECEGFCLGEGQIDPNTGQASQACVDDCTQNSQCCSGGPSGPPSGKCAVAPSSTNDGGTNPTPTPITWAGTWNTTVAYDVACDYAGNVKKAHHEHTLTMKISGPNSSLEAAPDVPNSGYSPLSGTGNDSGATLSGQFPFRDASGQIVSASGNSSTLKLTDVANANAASGSFQGQASDRFGAKCTVSGGTVSISR